VRGSVLRVRFFFMLAMPLDLSFRRVVFRGGFAFVAKVVPPDALLGGRSEVFVR
jgi:hypothetical protein